MAVDYWVSNAHGAVPPAALRDRRYAATAFAGGTPVFLLHQVVNTIPVNVAMVLDAAGLAFFAIAGTEKALLYKMHPSIAVLLGTITGVGGGTMRDLLLARVPRVLEADVYATAARAGSLVMILCLKRRLKPTVATFVGGDVLPAESDQRVGAREPAEGQRRLVGCVGAGLALAGD